MCWHVLDLLLRLRPRSTTRVLVSVIVGNIWMSIFSSVPSLLFSEGLTLYGCILCSFNAGWYTLTNIPFDNLCNNIAYLRELIDNVPELHIHLLTKFNKLLVSHKLLVLLVCGFVFNSFQYWLCRWCSWRHQCLQGMLDTLNFPSDCAVLLCPRSRSCVYIHRPNLFCQRCELSSRGHIFQLIHTNLYFSI
jgi:hypothetical protein